MDLALTPEQELVRSTLRSFVKEHVMPHASTWDREEAFPRKTFDGLAPLGFLGALVTPELGGAGLDKVSYLLALEELAYGDAGLSVSVAVHTSVGTLPILWFGNDEQKKRILPDLASGKKIAAFAITEPGAGSDVAAIATRAVRQGDHYILNGSKLFITNGSIADRIVVAARTSEGDAHKSLTLFCIDTHTPGFSAGKPEHKMGLRSSVTTSVAFQDLKVPAKDRLGAEGEGFSMLMRILNASRLGIAAQALGMARRALDESVAYAKERHAFGVPIGKHQAIQFRLADMATRIDAATLATYRAAGDDERGELKREVASMAKLLSSETLVWVAEQAVQIHGGNGYLKDYVVERIMRDAPITRIYEGTSEVQKIVIGRALAKR